MNEFELALTSGGDERIEILPNGLNKYFVNPASRQTVINRGSCTCNKLTKDVRPQVESLFNQLTNKSISLEAARENQRTRLKSLIGRAADDFEIAFAPSGSELCYIPLLIAMMNPEGKPLMNLVTRPEELGTGSLLANRGLYFGEKTQLRDFVEKGAPIDPTIEVNYRVYPARDEFGKIIDHREKLREDIKKYKQNHKLIVNLVIGSKSGIEDDYSIIDEFPDDDIIWSVDMCQLRASTRLIKHLLSKNCLVMTTGSKFYQAPPFCGAMLIPDKIVKDIQHSNLKQTYGFDSIFSAYDFPLCLGNIRSKLPSKENIGLTLRWESAIVEAELIEPFGEASIIRTVQSWSEFVKTELKKYSMFELMEDQELTNYSIISFRVKKPNGFFMTFQELKELYKRILCDEHDGFKDSNKVIIGQPVAFGQSAFIRLAIGSFNVRKLLQEGMVFLDDETIIRIIANYSLSTY